MKQTGIGIFIVVHLLLLPCFSQKPPPAKVPGHKLPSRPRPWGKPKKPPIGPGNFPAKNFTYCTSDEVSIPRKPSLSCTKCTGRCGDIKDFTEKLYCSCDVSCVVYGDCCPDFEQSCPTQYLQSSSLRTLFKHGRTECFPIPTLSTSDKEKAGLSSIEISKTKYSLVSVCGQTGIECNRTGTDNLLEPNFSIPVVDSNTGIHYVNFDCARCNGITEVIPWIPKLACNPRDIPPLEKNETFSIDSQEELGLYLERCEVNYIIPSNTTLRRFCGGYEKTKQCPDSCNNSNLIKQCEESYKIDYVQGYGDRNYDNFFCALCAGEIAENLRCPVSSTRVNSRKGKSGIFSLSLLFDFDPSEGVTVGRKACSEGQKWLDSVKECRQMACPDGLRLLKETCVEKSIQLEIKVLLFFNFSTDLEKLKNQLENDNIPERLDTKLEALLDENDTIDIENTKTFLSEKDMGFDSHLEIGFHENSTFNPHSDLGMFINDSVRVINDELLLLINKSGVKAKNVEITLSHRLTTNSSLVPTDCTWFHFSKDEFLIQNDTVMIQSTKAVYIMERYRQVQTGVFICVLNKNLTNVIVNISDTLGIITIILISLSIICLTIRLVLQFKISFYWSFAGRAHFNLCLSLCLAFTMLLVGGIVGLHGVRILCTAIGVLMYWFFLAAFSWTTAITYDTWLVFRPSAGFVRVDDLNKSMKRYALLCWGITAILAAIATGMDYVDMDARCQPQFGVNICWFNQRYALLWYFGVPVALLTMTATILFILTIIQLRKTMQSTLLVSTSKVTHQVWLYFRLFTLMGVSWIFGFIAAFVGHDALWIIFIILNASQGILLFVSFVLHHQVVSELKKIWKISTESDNVGSSGLSDSQQYSKGKATASTSI